MKIHLENTTSYKLPKEIIEERKFLYKFTGDVDKLLDVYYEMLSIDKKNAEKIIVIITRRQLHFLEGRYTELDINGNVKIIGLETRIVREETND